MEYWAPEQLMDSHGRLCGCNHLKIDHTKGLGKCLFTHLKTHYAGLPYESDCPCQTFVEDEARTEYLRAELARRRAMSAKVIIVMYREATEEGYDDSLALVGSCWESTLAWIRRCSPQWGSPHPWWWLAYEREVDSSCVLRHRFFDRNGVEHDSQATLLPDDLRRLWIKKQEARESE